jgi:hypothetical protein
MELNLLLDGVVVRRGAVAQADVGLIRAVADRAYEPMAHYLLVPCTTPIG